MFWLLIYDLPSSSVPHIDSAHTFGFITTYYEGVDSSHKAVPQESCQETGASQAPLEKPKTANTVLCRGPSPANLAVPFLKTLTSLTVDCINKTLK